MPNKALEITTTTHAVAVAVYISQAILGAWYLLDLATATSMTNMVGSTVVDLWALLLLLSGVFATAASFSARSTPIPSLRLEMWACLVLSLISFWYEATLIVSNGLFEVVTTQTYALMVAISCLARVFQIRRERTKIFSALSDKKVATVVAETDER